MKIGVRAHDLYANTTEEIVKICKENNIDALQLVIKKTFPDQFMDDEFIKNQIQEFRNSGIEIALLGSYFNMIHPDSLKLKEGIDTFKRNVQIAKDNNIKYIGSETGSVNGDEWTYNELNHTIESRNKLHETIDVIMNGLEDTNYLLEPVFDHVVFDENITKEMIDKHNMQLTFDLANVLNIENYTSYEQIFEQYLNMFGDKIKLFHFKNFNIIDGKKTGCMLSDGVIDYTKILTLVKKYNLTQIPVIVEELEGSELFNSIKYLKELTASSIEGEK